MSNKYDSSLKKILFDERKMLIDKGVDWNDLDYIINLLQTLPKNITNFSKRKYERQNKFYLYR